MNIVLWIVQGLLALVFLVAGFTKVAQPKDKLNQRMTWTKALPLGLVRSIGVAEILGAVGLILPGATKIVPALGIAAAVGLGVVMLGAITLHASRKEGPNIGFNTVLFLLAVFVIVGRIAWSPF